MFVPINQLQFPLSLFVKHNFCNLPSSFLQAGIFSSNQPLNSTQVVSSKGISGNRTPLKDFFDPRRVADLSEAIGGVPLDVHVNRRTRRNLMFGLDCDSPASSSSLRRRSRSANDIDRLVPSVTNSPALGLRSPSCLELRPRKMLQLKKPDQRRPFR